ncbi:PGDYG domain-containing protein [Patescibacteria group bacterium]|nr:PGDYG domain-containing protein [Patescibacteria group bacterium]
MYQKKGTVLARKAVVGEKVITVLSGGSKETENIAGEDDWVVTNPSGEEYLISEKKFFSRYSKTVIPGVFKACGYCKAIRNPFGVPIEIMASWGSTQTGEADCFIADVCDSTGTMMDVEPYLIDGEVFFGTYEPK